MKAIKVIHTKETYADGFIEIAVWKIPEPLAPSTHYLKYSLVYTIDGIRVVGYDNERGKGDHKHFRDKELPYFFISPEKLIADFIQDIEGEVK